MRTNQCAARLNNIFDSASLKFGRVKQNLVDVKQPDNNNNISLIVRIFYAYNHMHITILH